GHGRAGGRRGAHVARQQLAAAEKAPHLVTADLPAAAQVGNREAGARGVTSHGWTPPGAAAYRWSRGPARGRHDPPLVRQEGLAGAPGAGGGPGGGAVGASWPPPRGR